jgi:chromosome segregation ATPase
VTSPTHLHSVHFFGQAAYDRHNAELEDELAALKRFDNELKALERAIKDKKESIDQAELRMGEVTHEISNMEKDKQAAENQIAHLEKQNEWIVDDKQCVHIPHRNASSTGPFACLGMGN